MSCPGGDSVSNNFPAVGALVLQYGSVVTSGQGGGLKGRLNFMMSPNTVANNSNNQNTSPATHLITLGDSNAAKTLATPGHRPTNDANDTWIGLDNPNANTSGFQLAFGAPVSISNYIGNTGDNTNWLERLTGGASPLKTFKVPITTNSLISSTLPSGPPFAVASSTPVTNLTAVPTTYSHSGTQQTNTHIVFDTVQLDGNGNATVTLVFPATFTLSSTYVCTAADNGGANSVRVINQSGSSIQFMGTASHAIGYLCVGN